MNYDLERIRGELGGAVLRSPISWALAIAVVDDLLRDAVQAPLGVDRWEALKTSWRPLIVEQVGMIAHLLQSSSHLRVASVASLIGAPADAASWLGGLLDTIPGVTGEMIRKNHRRQEEVLRRWIKATGGAVAGETPEVSAAVLDRLDYRKAQAELLRAKERRDAEEAERARLLAAAEAARKEAEARGGYE